MPITHHLKVSLSVWLPLSLNYKTCEFRKNDRKYKSGDILVLRPWDDEVNQWADIGLGVVIRRVTHIIYGPDFGIPEGYCLMSIKPVNT